MQHRVSAMVLVVAAIAGAMSCADDAAGAGGGRPRSVADALKAADDSGAFPALDRGPTVTGSDADLNGIRDDIDAYITGLADSGDQKAALRQIASAIQGSLTVDTADQAAVLAMSRRLARATACIYARYDVATARRKNLDIEKLTANTQIRFNAYVDLDRALSGTTFILPQGDGCDSTPVAGPDTRLQATAASDHDLCVASGYTVGFFNGVWNSRGDAADGLAALRALVGDTYHGEPVQYEVFYNTTGCGSGIAGKVGCLQDLAEVFQQHAVEIDATGQLGERWEFFWESLTGNRPFTDKLVELFPDAASLFATFEDDLTSKITADFAFLLSNPPTEADYAVHNTRLDALVVQRQKLMLVAHSQGNLFVNHAYDHVVPKIGASSVATVHIAPASPTLRGDYILADIDLVIGGLRALLGSNAVPPSNISLPLSFSDITGHTLVGTYLDATRPARPRIATMLDAAMSRLVTPAGNGHVGAFTVTLTWDGPGDVDLHTFEPGGAHVYYANKTGQVGFLDVDNVLSNGPEHYYATCDPSALQTGLYRFGINDFSGATGRTATVQVSSSRDGTILTKSLDVGPVRGTAGNDSPIPAFTVTASKDASGNFSFTAN